MAGYRTPRGMQSVFARLPVHLGTPLRVGCSAWPTWGISWDGPGEFRRLLDRSERAYRDEWDGTTEPRHEEIAEAAKRAGLSDANRRLNEELAQVVLPLVAGLKGSCVRILDLGSGTGATTLGIWRGLAKGDQDRTKWTLLDPASQASRSAEETLLEEGLPRSQFQATCSRDLDAFPWWSRRFDIVVAVASIHHHSDLRPVFRGLARCLKPGGRLVIADWFNGLSLHPSRVLSLLKSLAWPTKSGDLRAFRELFPASAKGPPTAACAEDRRADGQIGDFWRAYARLRRPGPDSSCVLEGHRRVRNYVADLQNASFRVPRHLPDGEKANPFFLLPGSSLLGVIIAVAS